MIKHEVHTHFKCTMGLSLSYSNSQCSAHNYACTNPQRIIQSVVAGVYVSFVIVDITSYLVFVGVCGGRGFGYFCWG